MIKVSAYIFWGTNFLKKYSILSLFILFYESLPIKKGMEKRIKLSAFAKSQGITYQAAWKMWERGDIEGIKLDSGTILVSGWSKQSNETTQAIIYVRVSAPELIDELEQKIVKAKKYATDKNYDIVKIVKEVSSGMNFERPKLLAIMENKDWDVLIIVDAHDISSLNFKLIKASVTLANKRIETVNPVVDNEKFLLIELSQKIIAWSKHIIGMGAHKQGIMEILKQLNK